MNFHRDQRHAVRWLQRVDYMTQNYIHIYGRNVTKDILFALLRDRPRPVLLTFFDCVATPTNAVKTRAQREYLMLVILNDVLSSVNVGSCKQSRPLSIICASIYTLLCTIAFILVFFLFIFHNCHLTK